MEMRNIDSHASPSLAGYTADNRDTITDTLGRRGNASVSPVAVPERLSLAS